jgi:bacteriorhodopsin
MGAPMSTFTVDNPADAFLGQHDFTAVSFWIISIAMLATTVFLFAESGCVHGHWKTSVHVGGLVTLVAAVHYMYMREYWVAVQSSPVVYRYIDWTITVPLQMIEFNLIIKAAGSKIGAGGFWRLLIGTVVMLVFGYYGETNKDNHAMCMMGFAIGMAGWAFILFEIFVGESAKECPKDEHVQTAFTLMKLIVSVGWSIYPLGYYFGTLTTVASPQLLNVIYNIADFVNKIAFVLCCWSCAKSASEKKEALLA